MVPVGDSSDRPGFMIVKDAFRVTSQNSTFSEVIPLSFQASNGLKPCFKAFQYLAAPV